jgi:hypothetical protein
MFGSRINRGIQIKVNTISKAILLSIIFTFSHSAVALSPVVTEANLQEVIFVGSDNFSNVDLSYLDVNLDGAIDVADLVMFTKGEGDAILDGYKWLVLASFNSNTGNQIPYSYAFVLSIFSTDAKVSDIDQFDPTKPLLHQNISVASEIPGVHRAKYSLSHVLPIDTVFSKTDSGFLVEMTGSTNISKDDVTNAIGVDMTRTWIIEIDRSKIYSNSIEHGSITEEITGVSPGSIGIKSVGSITAVRFMPNEIPRLEGE